MARYLVAIHHPDDYDPFVAEDESMRRDIAELNSEMVSAGVRLFVGGLHRAMTATSIAANADGSVETTAGPYLKTTEHMAGFWVLEVGSLEEALEWGRKAAIACRAPVEVRAFH